MTKKTLGKIIAVITFVLIYSLTSVFQISPIAAPLDAISFPDSKLKTGLINNGVDLNNDTFITKSELGARTGKISFTDLDVTNLEGMQYATGINDLQLNNNKVSDLKPISDLVNLKNLDISGNDILEISDLSKLINLENLDFSTNKVETIGSISNMNKLLNLSFNNNMVFDMTPIKDITTLQTLSLLNNKVANVQPLSNLSGLAKLDLQANLVGDISPLNTLVGLQRLDLNSNLVTDISVISGLVNLKFLVLNNNKISNISAISNFKMLEELYLKNNLISDISALNDLDNLKILDLSYNLIETISVLLSLGGLEEVFLSNNLFDFAVGSPAWVVIDNMIKNNLKVKYGIITPSPSPTPIKTPSPTPTPRPTPPVITIKYNTKITNKNVLVVATVNKGRLFETQHTFTVNGSFVFKAIFNAVIYSKTVTIKNIDKLFPSIKVKDSRGRIITKNGSSKGSAIVTCTDTNFLKKSLLKNNKSVLWPRFNKIVSKGNYVVSCFDKAGNVSKFSFKVI